MKQLLFLFLLLHLIISCKKEPITKLQTPKIYWGNAIYGKGIISIDSSNYLPIDTIQTNGAICLIPLTNDFKPYTEMIINDTINTIGIVDRYGICFMNNIPVNIRGLFKTQTLVNILPCEWSNHKLTSGTIVLNIDNSIDIEYTDSLTDGSNNYSHYKLHYTK